MATTPLPGDVHRALRLLEDSPETDHSVAALAKACQVAPRTLQKHFQQFLGQSPTQVLREMRLNLVRRGLLLGHGDSSISDLATRYGFHHLGRFSAWYRDRYGESPSATLHQAQRSNIRRNISTATTFVGLDRPTVAVLPFRFNGQSVLETEVLPDEIAVALTRRPDVTVTSPSGARYRVHGKIHSVAGEQVRVVVTLQNAASDRVLWADAWTCEPARTPDFAERVAERVTTKLLATIQHVEMEWAWSKDVHDLSARELTMRALSRALVDGPSAQMEGFDLASKAVELATADPLPLALAAYCHSGWASYSPPFVRAREAIRTREAQVAQLRARDPTAEALLAGTCVFLLDLDAMDDHVERALALDGGCALAWLYAGTSLAFRGKPEAAIERLRISDSLDSAGMYRHYISFGRGFAHFEAGRYEQAARYWNMGTAQSSGPMWANSFVAPALALLGRKDEALASLQTLRHARPTWAYDRATPWLPTTEAFNDQRANGWESIGVRSGQ